MQSLLAPLIIFSGTVGAGIFTLPSFLARAGWMHFSFGLALVGALMYGLHSEYLRLTVRYPGESMDALMRRSWGWFGGFMATLSVYGGLFLALLVYIILGGRFAEILFPSLPSLYAPILFWFIASLPLLLNMRHRMELRFLIAGLTVFLIAFVVYDAWPLQLSNVSSFGVDPWSVYAGILFAFGGWASAEQVGKYLNLRPQGEAQGVRAILRGTLLVGFLYLLFAVAIVSSGLPVAEDTLSGLSAIPRYMQMIFALLGICALWNSFGAVVRELTDSMKEDAGMSYVYAGALTIFAPLALFLLGVTGLTRVVEVGGGLFGSLQYLAIALIALKLLPQTFVRRIALWISGALFLISALYEVYNFIVR